MSHRTVCDDLPPSTREAGDAAAGKHATGVDDAAVTATHDTVVDLGQRWVPPLAGDTTPVVRVLGDHADTPTVVAQSEPTPRAAPASRPVTPPAAGASTGPPTAWLSARKHRRPIPRSVAMAAASVVVLVVLVVLASRCQQGPTPVASTTYEMDDDLIVNHEDLRDRQEMTGQDFRSGAPERVEVRARRAEPGVQGAAPPIALDERRARREDNPEDLKARRRRPRRSSTSAPGGAGKRRRLLHEFDGDSSRAPAGDGGGRGGDRAGTRGRRRVAAATRVKARLKATVKIRSGRATALVRVGAGQALPAGTTLVGDARADRDGLVQIRFGQAVLPNGDKLRIEAEAQDRAGATGLAGHVSGTADDDEGSVAGDVAGTTGRRVLGSVLGNGILGGAAQDAARSRDRRSRRRPQRRRVVSLSKGTTVYVLFLDEVVEE